MPVSASELAAVVLSATRLTAELLSPEETEAMIRQKVSRQASKIAERATRLR
jgi:hypothetical protein